MIVNSITKIIYYKPIKVTINILDLTKVIINVIMYYYSILKSIIMDLGLLFILKV